MRVARKSSAFDGYLEALEAHQAGDDDRASSTMGKALGGKGSTAPIRGSIKKILKRGTLAHEAVLQVIRAEERKR